MIRLIILIMLLPQMSYLYGQSIIQPTQKPFALVELFTSQGCSSCPTAHDVVEHIYEDSLFGKNQVLILSFHVDYWNDLGWVDTFSQKAFTKRQSEYQKLFGAEGVYTPEFVVNGKSGFSGNNEPRLRRELKAIRADENILKTGIYLSELIYENDKLVFSYKLEKNGDEKVLYAAIVSKEDSTQIASGENGGQTIHSRNTVHSLLQLPVRVSGSRAYINLPKGFSRSNFQMALWVQDLKNAEVVDVLLYDLNF